MKINQKYWLLPILAAMMIFSACGSSEEPPRKPQEPASMFYERDYYFSSPDTKDKFYLGYHGSLEQLLTTDCHLHVVNPKGDTLFSDKWPVTQMIDATGAALPADSLRRKYVLQKMKDIIDDKSLPPAVVIKSPGADTSENSEVRRQAEMVFTYKVGNKYVKVLSWLDGKVNVLEF